MHIEFVVEDSSGATLLGLLIPKLIGPLHEPHSWRIHPYKGLGRLPESGKMPKSNPARCILLNELPRILAGLGRTPGIDAIVVVLDSDDKDCRTFLADLHGLAERCGAGGKTLIRLAIEEIEAWYFGDHVALLKSYPTAKKRVLDSYIQDSTCGTWERLADAIVKGGATAARRERGPGAGDLKHEWARKIGPNLSMEQNRSPSFAKFRDGVRRIVAATEQRVD